MVGAGRAAAGEDERRAPLGRVLLQPSPRVVLSYHRSARARPRARAPRARARSSSSRHEQERPAADAGRAATPAATASRRWRASPARPARAGPRPLRARRGATVTAASSSTRPRPHGKEPDRLASRVEHERHARRPRPRRVGRHGGSALGARRGSASQAAARAGEGAVLVLAHTREARRRAASAPGRRGTRRRAAARGRARSRSRTGAAGTARWSASRAFSAARRSRKGPKQVPSPASAPRIVTRGKRSRRVEVQEDGRLEVAARRERHERRHQPLVERGAAGRGRRPRPSATAVAIARQVGLGRRPGRPASCRARGATPPSAAGSTRRRAPGCGPRRPTIWPTPGRGRDLRERAPRRRRRAARRRAPGRTSHGPTRPSRLALHLVVDRDAA